MAKVVLPEPEDDTDDEGAQAEEQAAEEEDFLADFPDDTPVSSSSHISR